MMPYSIYDFERKFVDANLHIQTEYQDCCDLIYQFVFRIVSHSL